jgi:uncharacterized protein (DUF2147 family)
MRIFVATAASAIFASTVLATVAFASGASAQESAKGNWQRGDGVARVVVSSCGEGLCMKNTWIKPGSSEKVGEYLVLNVKPVGDGVWKGSGRDPQRNVNFSAEMKVAGNSMTTSGCVVGGIVCRSTQWTRLP